jgi:hypothetical protein
MSIRRILISLGGLTAVAALALLAFATTSPAHKADAAGLQPACTFATPIPALVQAGGGSDTVTCTFDVHGTTYTFVGDFTLTLGATPPVAVTGCTLNGQPIHIGRCP